LNSEKVEYLLVGGYAVGCYGYSRATGDMDIWIAVNPANGAALVRALRAFGFGAGSLSADMFLASNKVLRIGLPPLQIDIITSVAGIDFAPSFRNRVVETLDGVEVSVISLADLKANKQAAGRAKDLDDLEHLP
jgi:predicted nucleotidyltransferase